MFSKEQAERLVDAAEGIEKYLKHLAYAMGNDESIYFLEAIGMQLGFKGKGELGNESLTTVLRRIEERLEYIAEGSK